MAEQNSEPLDEELARVLVKEDETILQLQDELDEAFNQQLIAPERPVDQTALLAALAEVFQLQVDDTDRAYEMAESIYGYVITSVEGRVKNLKDLDSSEELIKYLNSLVIKYNDATSDLYLSDIQGKNYWADMNSELVIRGQNGAIGFNHQLNVGRAREFELSTSLESNLELAHRLLGQQKRAIDVFGMNTVDQVDPDQLDQMIELLQDIKESTEEYIKQLEEQDN